MRDRRADLVALLAAVLLGTGCGGKYASMSDADLHERSMECTSTAEPSPGLSIVCDNVRRECGRRREDGRYIC